jgi:hypothetical protein
VVPAGIDYEAPYVRACRRGFFALTQEYPGSLFLYDLLSFGVDCETFIRVNRLAARVKQLVQRLMAEE